MNNLSRSLTDWLYGQGAISEDDRELYEYAAYCFLITTAPLIMALLCSAMIGGVKQYIAILIPFMSLRQYCGGYHAKNVWVCMISSFMTLIFTVWIAMQDIGGIVHWLFVIAACVIIIKNSPIESENRKLNDNEKVEYRKKAVLLLIVFVLIVIILDIMELDIFADSVGIGIILVAFSQIVYVLKI